MLIEKAAGSTANCGFGIVTAKETNVLEEILCLQRPKAGYKCVNEKLAGTTTKSVLYIDIYTDSVDSCLTHNPDVDTCTADNIYQTQLFDPAFVGALLRTKYWKWDDDNIN